MSSFYNPQRKYNIFDPKSDMTFRISRSKIESFVNCHRCFYMDVRLGIAQPPGYPFSLNSAVDKLLKKEFDIHRAGNSAHPLMKTYGIDAVPYNHPELSKWRDPKRGISYIHKATGFEIFGGIDDIWINPFGEVIIVDYKATSKNGQVNLDAQWQNGYKRQMEIYQWLFAKNGFKVDDTGYFVYCNGNTDREAFDGKLEFDISILPYRGNPDWIEEALFQIRKTLSAENLPQSGQDCDFCRYRKSASNAESASPVQNTLF